MRRSTWKLNFVGAAALVLAAVSGASAQVDTSISGLMTHVEPAVSLVMPFDVTRDHVSFEIVSRRGGGVSVVATHWSFWSDSCDHLGDVFICLTDNDTVVVDPKAVQSQLQPGAENLNVGPVLSFENSRGFITVSQFEADTEAQSCRIRDLENGLLETPTLVGSWVIANSRSNAAYGNNAVGFTDGTTPQALPDTTQYFNDGRSGLEFQFFNPADLEDSEVYVIGLASPNGNSEFEDIEIGPIPANLDDGLALCCNAEYYDNIETNISLPDLCFTCSSFSALTEELAETDRCAGGSNSGDTCESDSDCSDSVCGEHYLIPTSKVPNTSGFLALSNCYAANGDAENAIVDLGEEPTILTAAGEDQTVFPVAFHGMAVGPYGMAVSGKYTLAADLAP